MSYIHVDSNKLIRLVNNIVGFAYRVHAKNYYSELKRQIDLSPHIPINIKSKNFARITRNFREALDHNRPNIPLSVDLLNALFSLFFEKPIDDQKTSEESWFELIKAFEESEGITDPFENTKWTMYFLDNDNRSISGFNLFKGILSFTDNLCNLSYQRHRKTNKITLYGSRSFVTSNNNVLKVKLWTQKKHMGVKEPYVILQFIVDNIKLHPVVEGLYLLYEGDNILYSGTVLLNQVNEKEEVAFDYINLHEDDAISRFDINRRAIVQYFSGRYKNVIQTSNGVLGNFNDLIHWNQLREQKLYRKNVDIFISTPISILKTREEFIAVRMLTILLNLILKNVLGLDSIFCSITSKEVLLDQNRYKRRQTLNNASEKFRRSKRYLFFNPIKIDSFSVSGAYLELGWALFDRKIIPSYVMTASEEQLPKYVRDVRTDNEKFGVAANMNGYDLSNIKKDSNELDSLFYYFKSRDMISNICEASIYYNIYGVMENDIIEEIDRLRLDKLTIKSLTSAFAESENIFNQIPRSLSQTAKSS